MRIIKGGVTLATAVALLGSAACGSSGGKATASSSTPAGSASGGFAAYAQCLREHGVNIPTSRPTARPGGRAGGFGFRNLANANPQALQACRSLMPQRRGPGMQALQAFRSCLSDHGVTLPTPSPGAVRPPGAARTPGVRRSPGAGMFGRLNTADPKVAKALKTCRPLLPTRSPRPSPS